MSLSLNPRWNLLKRPIDGARRRRRLVRRAVLLPRMTRVEALECRRLLVAEGAPLELSQVFDATGLVGSYTSTIHWGDGTSSSGNVTGAQPSGPLSVRFVYSANDTFFSGANTGRRTILQAAADSIIERLTDDLTAIQPTSLLQWTANTIDPSTGGTLRVPNRAVAANELVIYVGARNLAANQVGEGAPGTYEFPAVSGLTPQQLAQVQAFRDNVITRGETGVTGSSPTDYATWGGTISFDTDTSYYFGLDANAIAASQVDFYSVAAHELLHVLGFGVRFVGATSSWQHLIRNGSYSGAKGNAAYPGSASIPLDPDAQHFSENANFNGAPLLMTSDISRGRRFQLTPVDLAVLDDLGWTVNPNTATVTATHVFPDDGNYSIEVVLSGNRIGSLTKTLNANVTNVTPSVVAADPRTVFVGETVSIANIGMISDPGFRNPSSNPPTAETFSYSIDWRDGTALDRGQATIDRHGTAAVNVTTLASFDGSHVFNAPGTYNVRLTVTDDDGGTGTAELPITVVQRPSLSVALTSSTIRESAGAGATSLTVSRSGPAITSDQVITLRSSDITEAVVPASVTILSGQTSASVLVDVVDDRLLDGTQTVVITASGANLTAGEATLNVSDHETLTAQISANEIIEDQPGSVSVTLTRSNTDTTSPLNVTVGGRNPQIDLASTVTIPAGSQSVVIPLRPVDDDEHEPPLDLEFTFTAAGYDSDSVALRLIDDERPLFQNPVDRLDIDGNGSVTTNDALRAINELSRRTGGSVLLDPTTSQPDGVFFDVNGDYQLTALDALIVINELSRRPQASFAIEVAFVSSAWSVVPKFVQEDDDEESREAIFYQLGLSGTL